MCGGSRRRKDYWALHRPLRVNEYHVLHFIGHGGYDENAQDGALALQDANRKPGS
jgi:hypothetical protein